MMLFPIPIVCIYIISDKICIVFRCCRSDTVPSLGLAASDFALFKSRVVRFKLSYWNNTERPRKMRYHMEREIMRRAQASQPTASTKRSDG